ncbi:Protein of unknown function [Deinococcus reticulitermitis]|uniref:DUF3293 domain-containing protein n=1 Tax=Deinococcus reticulitermitis TaxID=856736 RepID=A0A1H6WXR9_9DEIO|nr:DUF3293 domain-containing protein [Deinococcus reticulitermitis]SEJ21618.1 Protein of unknown function [Deinococcus reticulitermitis]
MSPAEPPPEALRQAFLTTAYGPPGARMRLCPERSRPPSWADRGQSWAIVTAWNPGACRAEHRANLHAHARLLTQVLAARLSPVAARNGTGEWTEEGLLIPGASLKQTLAWTRSFGQEAALWGVGARAALVWRTGRIERGWAVAVTEDPVTESAVAEDEG